MSNNELLEKVIVTGADGLPAGASALNMAAGGLLPPQAADRFIDYMFDQTVLGQQVRQVRMRSNEMEIERIAVGERIMRVATEAVDDGVNVGVTFQKVSLTTRKLRLDWELSTESLEDNIEGEALEDHIARLMSSQAANDLEDLAINGDVTLTGDPLLKAFNGWRKLLLTGGHVVDAAGTTISRSTFNNALKTMPRKFMQRRRNLRFFVPSALIQDYLFSLQQTEDGFINSEAQADRAINQSVVPEGPAGYVTGGAFGVGMQEVPLFPEYDVDTVAAGTQTGSDVWLTDTQNLIWAIKREVEVYREFKPKKDTIEYTVYTRVGAAVENPQASVVVKNVAFAV